MSETAHPKLVTLVRGGANLTQAELAAKMGVTQALVSKIESGLVAAGGTHLTRLAEALRCPESLLTDETPIRGLETTCLHNRKFKSKITATQARHINSITHLTRVTVEGLLTGIELAPDSQLRRFDIDEYQTPEDAARAARVAWRLPPGPVGDLTGIMESLGVVPVIRNLGTRAQDAVTSWPQGQPPIMVINSGMAGDRLRFSLAHEAGHIAMHAIPNDDQETQADRFASEFLAPAEDIEDMLVGVGPRDFPRLLALKAEWGVSIAALIRRARDLDKISPRQHKEFFIKLSRLGWRLNEPGDVPVESPQTLATVMKIHVDEHDYSTTDLAKVGKMLLNPFRKHYQPPEPGSPVRRRLRVAR